MDSSSQAICLRTGQVAFLLEFQGINAYFTFKRTVNAQHILAVTLHWFRHCFGYFLDVPQLKLTSPFSILKFFSFIVLIMVFFFSVLLIWFFIFYLSEMMKMKMLCRASYWRKQL